MKQLDVQIMGQNYLLGCPEGGEAKLTQAVQRVDAAMCKIRDAGKVRARDRIAVLAALNVPVAASGWLGADNDGIFRAAFARRGIADHMLRLPGSTRTTLPR